MSLTLLSSRSHGKIPKQLLIATLAGLYNTSPEDILRQLRAFDIPQIAPYATDAVDVNTLIYRLQYEKEASLDMLGSVWPIITEAILSRITGKTSTANYLGRGKHLARRRT